MLLVPALAGCRKSGENREVPVGEGEPVVGEEANPYGVPGPTDYQPVPAGPETAGEGLPPSGGRAVEDNPKTPVAIAIPGKPGFVFNPYTNHPVDVRGIPSKTLVRDPQDPDKSHKFRVP